MDISKIEAGSENIINVFIESEKGSKNSYEYDSRLGLFKLKKVLGNTFPASHGFIPRTHHVDGKTLDVLILSSDTIRQGTLVQARPIGMVRLKAEVPDIVLIAVPLADKSFEKTKNLSEVSKEAMDNIKSFLQEFKQMEVDDVFDSERAKKSVKRAIELHKKSMME
jgi:inorganic pyrophosphatase